MLSRLRNKVFITFIIISFLLQIAPLNVFAGTIDTNSSTSTSSKTNITEETTEPTIVGEVVEKREKNVKQYLLSDYSYKAVVYPVAVHYQKDGKWVDIDNSLQETTDNNETKLENKSNDFNIKLAKNSNSENLVTLKKDKYTISYSIVDANKSKSEIVQTNSDEYNQLSDEEKKFTLTKLSSEVNFKDVFSNIDFNYVIQPEGIKENIVLNSKEANNDFEFKFKVDNLKLELRENTIVFFDSTTNEEVFIITAPYMFDSSTNEDNKSTAVTYGLKEENGKYILTLSADEEWLQDPNRVYPVTIDPTIETSLVRQSIHDAHVSAGLPTTNFNSPSGSESPIIKTGYGSTSHANRSLIKFDLPTLNTSDMIINAELNLSLYSSKTTPTQVNVHRVTSSWVPTTVTWNTQPTFDSRVVDYQMISGGVNSTFVWDITTIAKQWYTTGVNNGLLVKNEVENTNYIEYYSSDCPSTYQAYRPQVIIDYVNNNGLESYWTYHSQDLGRAGVGSVNDYNGNLIFIHGDVSLSGNRMPININHVYNINDRNTNIGYGNGFRLNLHQTVNKVIPSGSSITYYKYTDSDGTAHYFPMIGSSPYKDEDGLGYEVVENSGSTTARYTITDKSDNKMEFNSSGLLVKIIHSNSNTQSIAYTNNKISSVTDGSGRSITIQYTNDILSSITDNAGRITYYYYTSNNLTKIKYPDNYESNYTYDSDKKLVSAKKYDGYEVTYGYTPSLPYRINKITEKNGVILGQELTLTYGDNTTSFTDVNNRTLIYQFNDAGHTVSIQNDEGYAQYYSFFDTGIVANKLSAVSKLQKTVTNYLLNHSAENGNSSWSQGNGTGSDVVFSIATNQKYIGNNSFKIVKNNTVSRAYYQQTLLLQKGSTYTFSSYVKTSNISNLNSGGVRLFVVYKDKNDVWVEESAPHVTGTNDWQRISTTFTLPSDSTSTTVYFRVGITSETGTAYFDNLQVEDKSITNRYNLVENVDLLYGSGVPTYWTSSSGSKVSLTTPNGLDTSVFKITGVANSTKNIYQDINVSGTTGDAYTFSGWAKGDSVGIYGSRKFGLKLDFYNGTTLVNSKEINFNPSSTEWQYASSAAIANSTYTKVRISGLYDYNENDVYFDGFQVYKENFSTSYQYDANGNIVSTEQLSKEDNTMQYSSNNDLMKLTDEVGSQFTYNYDSKHNLLSALSAEGVKYDFTYDSYGNNTSMKVKSNLIAYYSFNANNLNDDSGNGNTGVNHGATFVSGKSGNAIEFNGTSSWAELTNFSVPDNFSISMWIYPHSTNDGQAFVSKHDSSGNNIMLYGYWSGGFHVRIRNDVYISGTKYANTFKHQVITFDKINDTQTKVTVYVDKVVLWEKVINDIVNPSSGKPWSLGQEWDGSTLSDFFDGDIDELAFFEGALTQEDVTSLYNSVSIDTTEYKNYISSSATYEASGQYIDKTTDAFGNVVDYNWDATKGLLNNVKDAKGNTSSYTYNATNDQLTKVSNSLSSIDYGYNGDFLKNITHNGFSYYFNNDVLGNLTSVKIGTSEASATSLVTNTYEARTSRLLQSVYGNGGKVVNSYDQLDRIVGIKYDSDSNNRFIYEYDASGNLGYIKDTINNVEYFFAYDMGNRLSEMKDSLGNIATYSYDQKNNLSSVIEVLSGVKYTTNYQYNKDNQLTKMTYENGKYVTCNYDTLGRLTSTTLSTGSYNYNTSIVYNAGVNGSQSTLIDQYSSGPKTYSYTYDANGNIASIHDGSKYVYYQYDANNQLIRENNQVLNKTISYTYDGSGNILEVNEYAYTTGTFGTPTKTKTYTYDSVWKDKLVSFDGKAITYDAIGNTKTYDGYTFTWEAGRQLSGITGNGKTISYKYNDSGIRTQKTVNGVVTNFILEGDQVVLEKTGTDTIHYSYDANGKLVSMNLNGSVYFYERNAQGDITGIRNNSGVQLVVYTYDTWGKIMNTIDTSGINLSTKNPYRYRGYRYDEETGLYYLQSRYYNPTWGRFINADAFVSTGQGFIGNNMFAYANNNPIMFVDPSGNWPIWIENTVSEMVLNVKKIYNNLKSDINNFDIHNTNENTVLNANYFSIYKGTIAIKPAIGYDAASYGVMIIGNKVEDINTVKHEYGHVVQLKNLGVIKYTTSVALPSLTANILDRNNKLPYDYYGSTWEHEADVLGGVLDRPDQLWPNGTYNNYFDLIKLFFK